MNVRGLGVLCVFAIAFATTVRAGDQITGIDLYKWCETNEKEATSVVCTAYVAGFVDGMQIRHVLDEDGHTFCPPKGGGYGQMVLVVRKFMADHPEYLNEHIGTIVGGALSRAFPCS